MALESIGSGTEESIVEMVGRIATLLGSAADETLNVTEAARGTKFAEWIPKKSILSGLRLGMMMWSMVPTIASGPPDTASIHKGFQVTESIVLGKKKSEAQEVQEKLSLPGPEQYQSIQKQVRTTVEQLRNNAGSDPVKIAAFNFAIGNILDPEVNPLVKAMFPGGNENQQYLVWLRELQIPADFSEVYTTTLMKDDAQLRSVTHAIRDWYRRDEVRAMRKLVHDPEALFSWEVVFDAMRPGEHAYDELMVKEAAENLLKQGNIEQVIKALESVKAPVPVEGLYKVLLRYFPNSEFVREHRLAEKVSLKEDPKFLTLNA